MSHGIRITPLKSDWTVEGLVSGYRLKLIASDATYGDGAIFRYRVLPLQPDEDEARIVFDGVVSVADMEQYPALDAPPDEEPPYFRLSYCDIVFRSLSTAESAYTLLMEEIATLVEALNLLDVLEEGDAIDIGVPLNGSSSSA